MQKQYNKVSDLVKSISKSSKVKEKTLKEIENRSISKFLFFLRCEHNLTQKILAEKIGCTQSRVSKIESSYDADLSVKDLLDYGDAINLNLELGYRQKNAKITDLIKYHVIRAKEYLSMLTDMVKGDKTIKGGVLNFMEECLYNFLDGLTKSLQKLNLRKNISEPKDIIHISPPLHDRKIAESNESEKLAGKT